MQKHLIVGLFAATPLVLVAQESSLPVIAQVVEISSGTQIRLQGVGFGSPIPIVTLGSLTLNVVESTNTAITAQLPVDLAAGSYLVVVRNSQSGLFGFMSMAITAPATTVVLTTAATVYTASFNRSLYGLIPEGTILYFPPDADTIAFIDPSSVITIADTQNANFVVAPSPCTVTSLAVGANGYVAAGVDTVTLTVYKNSLPTNMTCSVTVDGNGASCSDSLHAFSVAGGDTLTLGYTETNNQPYVKVTSKLLCS